MANDQVRKDRSSRTSQSRSAADQGRRTYIDQCLPFLISHHRSLFLVRHEESLPRRVKICFGNTSIAGAFSPRSYSPGIEPTSCRSCRRTLHSRIGCTAPLPPLLL